MSCHCSVCVRLSHLIKDYLLTYLLTYYVLWTVLVIYFESYMYLFCNCSKLEQQNEMLKLAAKEV